MLTLLHAYFIIDKIVVLSVNIHIIFLSLSLSLSLSLFLEFATIESPPHRSCIGLKLLRQLCSWHRLVVLVITVVPLLYLIAIEIAITVHNEELVC